MRGGDSNGNPSRFGTAPSLGVRGRGPPLMAQTGQLQQAQRQGFSTIARNALGAMGMARGAPMMPSGVGRGIVRGAGFHVRPPPQQAAVTNFNSRFTSQADSSQSLQAPTKVFMDAQGRVVDEQGNILNVRQQKELKINAKNEKEDRTRDLERLMKSGKSQALTMAGQKRKYFDQTLESGVGGGGAQRREKRKKTAFHFVNEGTYVKRGEMMRRKQVAQDLENDPLTSFGEQLGGDTKKAQADQVNVYGEQKIVLKQNKIAGLLQVTKTDVTPAAGSSGADAEPQCDWWDAFFLPPDNTESKEKVTRFAHPIQESNIYMDRVTHFIQHPVPLKNAQVEAIAQMTIPFFLTEQEKKKLRRKKRLEKEKEKQEKVSLGLMPVPAPRVTMSNYLRVMTKEAIADPSKCEKEVKKIVAKRVQDHLNRNEAGKLTREQKEEKMKRKANRDYDKDAKIALFKITKVALQAQLKFKVTMNAQQLHLSGLCMIADPHLAPNLPHLIVVEGGPHAIKQYKKLMLRRIDWQQTSQSGEKDSQMQSMMEVDTDNNKQQPESGSKGNPECTLVFEGASPAASATTDAKRKVFEKWKVVDIRTEAEAKRLLSDRGMGHLWNSVMNYQSERDMADADEKKEEIARLLI